MPIFDNKNIRLPKKHLELKQTTLAICIFVIYLTLNLYVSFFQTKVLLIGDWPHDLFDPYYGSMSIAFAWSPSLSFTELDQTVRNNKFDIVILDIQPSIIDSSDKNKDIINELSKSSKMYLITNDIDDAQYVNNRYALRLRVVMRTSKNVDNILAGKV